MSAKSIISAARALVINLMRPFAPLRAVTDDLNLPINKIRNDQFSRTHLLLKGEVVLTTPSPPQSMEIDRKSMQQ